MYKIILICSLTHETVSEEKMPRRLNKIAVKWLDPKDMKNTIGQLMEIAAGGDVVMSFNAILRSIDTHVAQVRTIITTV